MAAESIFGTLAQQDQQLQSHNQALTQGTGNAENMFGHMGSNNGEAPSQNAPKGPTIGPTPSNSFDPNLIPDPFERGAYKVAGPFAKKALDAIDKLHEVENFTQEGAQAHPVQAFMGHIANRLEGFLFGNEEHQEDAIGSGKYGMATNPVTSGLAPGAGGEPSAAGLVRGAAGAVKGAVQGIRGAATGAEEAPGIVKSVLKGKEVAQEPAKAAIRESLGAGDEEALLEGHKTVADQKISDIAAKERAEYAKQDKTAGFDVKETRKFVKDAEEKLKQPELSDAQRQSITDKVTESKSKLAEAEGKGVDLTEADNLYKSRRAGMDFKKALVSATSPDGESVNVDTLLNSIKRMRATNKYGDRLEQFLGKEGAEKLNTSLLKAQEDGVHALKVQQVAKTIAKYVGIGAGLGAGSHIVREMVQ